VSAAPLEAAFSSSIEKETPKKANVEERYSACFINKKNCAQRITFLTPIL